MQELPGKEAADHQLEQRLSGNFQQEAAEAVKQSIGKATVSLGDAVQTTTDRIEQKINDEGISREFSTSLPAGSASVFKLDNVLGEISLVPASGDKIVVKATVVASTNVRLTTPLPRYLTTLKYRLNIKVAC